MEYNLSDLLNIEELQDFFNSFYDATNINCKIIDTKGTVLIDSGSRAICTNFHGNTPCTLSIYNQTNDQVAVELKEGKEYFYASYETGLMEVGVPIKIKDQYLATLYFGQFFSEAADNGFWGAKAEEYGFDRHQNINSSGSLPVIPHSKLDAIVKLMVHLCGVIEKLAHDSLQEVQLNKRLDANYQELQDTYQELVAAEEELRAQFEELQQSKHRLKQSEERYKLALLGSHDGIWDWDITNDSYYYSEKWANMLGYTKATLPLRGSWKEFIHPSDLEVFEKEISDYINKKTDRYRCEYRLKKADNTYIWVSDVGSATWDDNNTPVRMVGSHTDITEQKKWSDQIHKLAYYDSLTSLPNKFNLYQELSDLCQGQEEFAVIFMDLDNFKVINDMYSHTFGDNLLKKLAFELSLLVEKNCTIYRWGGDEFVLILRNVNNDIGLSEFLDRLIRLINTPFIVDDIEVYVSASLGACLYPRDSRTSEDLIKHSDTAMYQAKSSGKNSYQIYNPDLSLIAMEQITLERELRLALKNNEFKLYYQPRMDVKTNTLVGMEALVRWIKADGTIVPPLKFIPKAEETGLIVPIGEFVIRESCSQLRKWMDKGFSNLIISINLSAKQIEDRNLLQVVKSSIKETGINPSNIELEITESAAIKDMNQTLTLITALKDMGINVLLDDFGTGYSSLNFLRLLPVTSIKIDKSFMDKVGEDTAEKTIVRSLISLAHDIKMKVIAEGIETPTQLSFLKDNSCDEAQGFYFSRPVPPAELEALLEAAAVSNE
ncbi:EAL domain-containing protein [Clostridium thermarum]|uniref:EAL domain-containing protein n=1 Tax=Clostridium thermarum TaxID=1716543 RepID=UPI00111FCB3E|nr:EAL domain-containing protein [Clostridium thermarum]